MKTKVCAILLAALLCFSSVASALTAEQNKKLESIAALLNIMQKDYNFGDDFEEPFFEFTEDPAMMRMHFTYKGYETYLLSLVLDASPSTSKAPLLDLCQSCYNMLREATQDIAADLPIVVTIGGNDGGVSLYTINGLDVSDYIIEE